MKLLTVVFLLFLFNISAAEEMPANITSPVDTPFGIYDPHLVGIIPRAPICQPGEDLEYVSNLDDLKISSAALPFLKNNHFFITPAIRQDQSGYNEMFDIYNECRETGIPQFITTDAVLHGFHLMFDYILRTCEEERFINQLDQLLEQLMILSAEQYEKAANERVRQAIFRNRDYLLVASQLLAPKQYFADPLPGGKYFQELELINNAQAQLVSSPTFAYPEDYTQYKPRGHYTKSKELQQYFRSMMWLGRMTFSCEDQSDYASTMTLSAIFLTQAIATIHIHDNAGINIWENIYQPTVFFVGKSDDINFLQYLAKCYDIYGKNFASSPPDSFADREKLNRFLKATEQFPPASIGYPGQPRKGFRFMGQRLVLDSWILDELVFEKIPHRTMPTGLDVMIVLGPQEKAKNERAFRYLVDRDKDDQSYVKKIDSLKTIFRNYPDTIWAQNAYWNWLYCFMPLLTHKGEGYPYFMQTDAWGDKDLHAALASWAELRHDTILYAKQSGTERGIPAMAPQVQGYVEPNPHFYARMTSLADFMIKGLASRDLLFDTFESHLKLFSELAECLQLISEKELTGAPLSSQDYLTIFEFGKTLYDIVTFQEIIPSPGPQPGNMSGVDPMPVIADVHYDSNSGTVLEEAVGYPYAIYVICNIEGQPIITKGAGFSYYEFTQPATNRLTDQQWRDTLNNSSNPPAPEWTSSFCVPQIDRLESSLFYEWKKPTTFGITHENLQTWHQGVPFTFRFSTNDVWASDVPELTITFADGRKEKIYVERDAENNGWRAVGETSGWPPGTAYIEITKGAGDNRLSYRTHFELLRTTNSPENTAHPVSFSLFQNYPNPFNPQTFIKIQVPKTSFISLEVFDIRGRRVRTLVSSSQPAGQYVVPWDGTNDAGQLLTSGIYYYRMKAGHFFDVKRMILLR